jgi:CDP-diacylglycerol--serine O-phosphatidyltransferase
VFGFPPWPGGCRECSPWGFRRSGTRSGGLGAGLWVGSRGVTFVVHRKESWRLDRTREPLASKRREGLGRSDKEPILPNVHVARRAVEIDRWKGYLPTWVTLGNGTCGILAIIQIGIGLALQEGEDLQSASHLHSAAWLILGGMVFDALDGFVARAMNKTSGYGAILDSLCDLISFGAAPAFLVFAIAWRPRVPENHWHERVLLGTAVAYALCAILRLARFTSTTAPDMAFHRKFRGLPSPAAAGVVVGAPLISPFLNADQVSAPSGWFQTALLGSTCAAALLMVSSIPFPHLINGFLKNARPLLLGGLALMAATVLVAFGGAAISCAFWGYALSGVLFQLATLARTLRRSRPRPK